MYKTSMNLRVAGVLSMVLLIFPVLTRAEVVVVASSKSGATSLTAEQAADIFLGKLKALPGAGDAVPIDQPEGSAVREEFYSKTTGRSAAQLKAYWAKVIFTGKGQPPKEVSDVAAIKRLVAENSNIVAYMERSSVDASLKILLSVR